MQVQAPQGVAEDFVRHALDLERAVSGLGRGAGRGEHIEAFGGADGVNAEQVRAIADDDQAAQPVGARDDGDAAAPTPQCCGSRFRR